MDLVMLCTLCETPPPFGGTPPNGLEFGGSNCRWWDLHPCSSPNSCETSNLLCKGEMTKAHQFLLRGFQGVASVSICRG